MRGTQSRGRGETAGVYERGVVDAGMETGDSQVGGWSREEAVDAGTESGDAQVGGGPRVVEKLGTREEEEVG